MILGHESRHVGHNNNMSDDKTDTMDKATFEMHTNKLKSLKTNNWKTGQIIYGIMHKLLYPSNHNSWLKKRRSWFKKVRQYFWRKKTRHKDPSCKDLSSWKGLERSGHDPIWIFCKNCHTLHATPVFWQAVQMILHHFIWGNAQDTLTNLKIATLTKRHIWKLAN